LTEQLSFRRKNKRSHKSKKAPPVRKGLFCIEKVKRVVVDEMQTLQLPEIPLLIKNHRKRGMGWIIALDERIFNQPTRTKEPKDLAHYYDYVI
jgi:hypothetical protein